MTITQFLKTDSIPTSAVLANRVGSFSFKPVAWFVSVFTAGVRFHHALHLLGDKMRLTKRERDVWSALSAVRKIGRSFGARNFAAEQSVMLGGYTGRVDLLALGPEGHGILELKVVEQLPAQPRLRDQAQLGAYVAMSPRAWGALLYLDLEGGKGVFFFFEPESAARLAPQELAA